MSARTDIPKYDNAGCYCAYACSGVNSSRSTTTSALPKSSRCSELRVQYEFLEMTQNVNLMLIKLGIGWHWTSP